MKAFGRVWLWIGVISFVLGLCLLILAGFVGYSMGKGDTYSFSEGYQEEIHSLDFSIDYGNITIIEGDKFSIDADDLYENGSFSSEVKNGVWTIRDRNHNLVNFFGLSFPVTSLFGERFSPELTITIPKDFVSEDINLEVGAVVLKVEQLRARTGSFTIGAGEAFIEQLELTEEASFDVGAGYLELNDMQLNSVNVDCGVGAVKMKGIITGKNYLSCGVGKISMELKGDIDDYSYDVSAGIGGIRVNGKNRFGSSKHSGTDILGSFNMDCGIGQISLNIYE